MFYLIESFNLTSVNNKATRTFTNRKGHTSIACIDYILAPIDSVNFTCENFNPIIADHNALVLKQVSFVNRVKLLYPDQPCYMTSRCYKKESFELLVSS